MGITQEGEMNKEILLELVDVMKDINKSVFMHIDNHNRSHVDDAIKWLSLLGCCAVYCVRVAKEVSDTLLSIERKVKGDTPDTPE